MSETTKYVISVMLLRNANISVICTNTEQWAYLHSDKAPRQTHVPMCTVRQMLNDGLLQVKAQATCTTTYELSEQTKLSLQGLS